MKKLFDLSPMGYYKVFGLAFKVSVLLLVVLGILWVKNLLFPPAPANVNQPEIHVAEGGTLHYNVEQNAKKERAWWIPGPFVELFGQMDSDHGKDVTVGTRFGARWDW